MFYTVIQMSGWQSDHWRIVKTFASKNDAEDFVSKHRQRSDPRSDFYNTKIKAHKKALAQLMQHDPASVTFADGTIATVNW